MFRNSPAARSDALPPIFPHRFSKGRRQLTFIIEPGIEPLVSALNKIEFLRTVYSCEGHFDRPHNEKFLPTAYVTFGVTDVPKFVPLYERIVRLHQHETETDFRLTYDCVLGRYTLSVWAGPMYREASQKRPVIDAAVVRLSEMVEEFIEQNFSSERDDEGDKGRMPCGEPVSPCTMVIPAKEMVCPFA
jgi:hypothetical protein